MPATENTWRDLKLMHVVFGCTSLLLLIATIWMFAADHGREWKRYQRGNRKVETKLTQWRIDQQARENAHQRTKLQAELDAELAKVPEKEVVDELQSSLHADDAGKIAEIDEIYTAMSESPDVDEKTRQRSNLLKLVGSIINQAKFAESNASRERKFKSAYYDKARADLDIGIRDQFDEERLAQRQTIVDELRAEREELTDRSQAATKYLTTIQGIQRRITAKEDEIRKRIADNEAEYNRLASSLAERNATYLVNGLPGKRLLELPIIDAFNSPLKIQNLWTDGLMIPNGSFGLVRRFDRCTTCHQNVDKTAPGSSVTPAYEHDHEVTILVRLPESKPAAKEIANEDGTKVNELPSLLRDFGFALADTGLINLSDVTISEIVPGSQAATALVIASEYGIENESVGFLVGDVVSFIGSDKVLSNNDVEQTLLRHATWGSTVEIRVHRGLIHPFSSHPRLDLFIGSLSPHPLAVFGCSVCHEGQGSATEFKWVSHTPNDPTQAAEWSRKHGWFNNHHWAYPMYPDRFSDSSCLRCHHEVVELDASERFPDSPAPKLVKGFNLIREYGCFGCHEINGYKTADKRQGPDMRLEPNYSSGAAQLKSDAGFAALEKEQQAWIRDLIHHPERDAVRRQLVDFLKNDRKSDAPQLSPRSHAMADVLADVEIPGDLRKVGPSLRHVASKVGPQFLYDWIRDPKHFRPSTRMPAFFGQWKHLESEPNALDQAKRFEPIEILGIVEYLRDRSQPMDIDAKLPDDAATDDAAVERGKLAFETRGCLACHMHSDFPAGKADQGPNLSNVGDKFALEDTPDARQWLYNWLRSPSSYHPRTKMPDLYLLPIENPDGTKTDPAADIASYLLGGKSNWQPKADNQLKPDSDVLRQLVLEHLKAKIFEADAVAAIENGKIPDDIAASLKGGEAELVGDRITDKMMLLYVGQKTINKYGCFACHDIPGFEEAKPIGTALADWGRKEPAKLAFEHIIEYIEHGHGQTATTGHVAEVETPTGNHEDEQTQTSANTEFDESYYHDKIMQHERDGFIWQKLKEPRSYDFMKAANKDSYNDRLRMPLFPFNAEEREAVVTFVLGLVAEPPAHQFVYHPDEKAAALIAGKKAIEKYNCGGCHVFEAQRWTVTAAPGSIELPTTDMNASYPFMSTQFPSDLIEASKQVDKMRGTITAHLTGMPRLNSNTGLFEIYDPDVLSLEPEDLEDPELDRSTLVHQFELWKPTLIEGQAAELSASIPVPESIITHKRPAYGGDLTFLLLPRVTELEKQANPGADGRQAWGWLPPPLVGEGNKVQSDWLHDFLLEPYKIRPATFLRMPKFNMSSAEATDFVEYFAARDNGPYPYKSNSRADEQKLATDEQSYQENLAEAPRDQRPPDGDRRFDHSMNIVTSSDYCVQCHMVGDFEPKTSDRAKAPNLAKVERRLQPDFVRTWIANPKQVLAYTPMPVNIKFDASSATLGGVDQKLYHGTSVEQLDAIVDLLMNFSRYTSGKTNVAKLVKPPTQPPAGSTPAANPAR